jgi:hypothetical protein
MEPTIEQGGSSHDDVSGSAQFNSQLGLRPLIFVSCLNFPLPFWTNARIVPQITLRPTSVFAYNIINIWRKFDGFVWRSPFMFLCKLNSMWLSMGEFPRQFLVKVSNKYSVISVIRPRSEVATESRRRREITWFTFECSKKFLNRSQRHGILSTTGVSTNSIDNQLDATITVY